MCVHARTRADGFRAIRRYDLFHEVKAAVTIPVIGNGGVDTPEVATTLMRDYGCDGVMVGRGAFGNPWLFRAIGARLRGEAYAGPGLIEVRDTLLAHLARAVEVHGEGLAVRRMRKHLPWYLRGLHGAHRIKEEVQRLATAHEVETALRAYFRELLGYEVP